MVDDYLYNGNGAIFALVLAGLASSLQPGLAPTSGRRIHFSFILIPLAFVFFVMINLNELRAIWLANLGAVQMARVELDGFPTGQWTEPAVAPQLDAARSTLLSALDEDSMNRTANHRLGLISMLRGDFRSAAAYLEAARAVSPNHRGIMKSLGYCYVWLGDVERAQLLLRNIPDANHEIAVYIGWWQARGRQELADNAALYLNHLKAQEE
jgi:lipopolysaccharide biosynthesis regulator YciM